MQKMAKETRFIIEYVVVNSHNSYPVEMNRVYKSQTNSHKS